MKCDDVVDLDKPEVKALVDKLFAEAEGETVMPRRICWRRSFAVKECPQVFVIRNLALNEPKALEQNPSFLERILT